MPLFHGTVRNADDWEEIFQQKEAFLPLVRHILVLHNLPQGEIANTTPGSHAVFRVGEVIVKIFAPDTVGWNCEEDFVTEITTMQFAAEHGIPVPHLLAQGRIMDKYCFRYLIMEFVHGTEFRRTKLTDAEKYAIGKQMRTVCEKMNIPCIKFNSYDVKLADQQSENWQEFPESLRKERSAWLAAQEFRDLVYVHGDIHADNAILTEDGTVVLLDFADSIIAPVSYEYAALIPGLFEFEKPYLDGFFGDGWDPDAVTEMLTEGLLLHRFGANIVIDRDVNPAEVTSIATLKEKIRGLLPL